MNYLNRRSFLKSSALFAGATLISPNLLSCQNPNSKLNIAVIGVGGRGRANYNPVLETENIVAIRKIFLKSAFLEITIGITITSGGIGKNELSMNDTIAK